jgi:hypothetical protein
MNARTIGGIFTVVSAALGAMVAWTTRAFPLDVRLLIVVVVGLGVLAGATALFAHFGHALTGMKRAVWSGGIGFVIALISVLVLGATLALHSICYEDVPCEDGGAWRCMQITGPRDDIERAGRAARNEVPLQPEPAERRDVPGPVRRVPRLLATPVRARLPDAAADATGECVVPVFGSGARRAGGAGQIAMPSARRPWVTGLGR